MPTPQIDKKFSFWISTVPWHQNMQDSEFMYLGSSSGMNQSISYMSATTGVLGQTPDTAIFVDGAGGAVSKITLSLSRPYAQPFLDDSSNITCTNKKFIETLVRMRTQIQMLYPAYVLRVYNISQMQRETYDKSNNQIISAREALGTPKELYVFLDTFDVGLDMDRPEQISINLSLIERNKLVGFNQ